MRAIFTRTSRKLSRTLPLNQEVSSSSRGTMENDTRASRQSSQNRMAAMPARTRTSPKMVTMPAVNISFRASTSVVTRVTSRPMGLRS